MGNLQERGSFRLRLRVGLRDREGWVDEGRITGKGVIIESAIGECGFDYHSLPSTQEATFANITAAIGTTAPGTESAALADADLKNRQSIFFQEQLDLAAKLGLNVVIHQRDSWKDTLHTLRPYSGRLKGVFHCFSGDPEQACHLIELGHSLRPRHLQIAQLLQIQPVLPVNPVQLLQQLPTL